MNKGEISFTEGPLDKKILKFAFPLIIAYLIQQAYNSADLIIIGHYMGTSASAAIGASSMVITLAIGLFGGLSMGVGMLFARAYGAHDNKRKIKIYHCTYRLGIVLGIGIIALGMVFAPQILIIMQTPQDIFELACNYLRVYLISITFMAIFNMFAGMVRATGNSKIPMIFQGISGAANVGLNFAFLSFMSDGIVAVAWATVVSQGLCTLLIVIYLSKNIKKHGEEMDHTHTEDEIDEYVAKEIENEESYTANVVNTAHESDAALDKAKHKEHLINKGNILKAIFILGLPVSIQTMVVTLSNMFVQTNINALGVDSISAFTAYFKIELFIYYPILSIGQAVMYAVSQNIGADKHERIKLVLRSAIKIGLIIVVPVEVVLLIFGNYLFAAFNSDANVIECGLRIIYTTVPFYLIYLILECMSNAVRSLGRSTSATIVSIFSFVGMRSLLLILLGVFGILSIVNVSAIYPITWAIAAALYVVLWNICKKKIININ